MVLWIRLDSFHGANGHDAPASSPLDCANGHDPARSGAGDDDVCTSYFPVAAIAESPALSQVQALRPQVGRFLYTPNLSGMESQASARAGPDPSSRIWVSGVR